MYTWWELWNEPNRLVLIGIPLTKENVVIQGMVLTKYDLFVVYFIKSTIYDSHPKIEEGSTITIVTDPKAKLPLKGNYVLFLQRLFIIDVNCPECYFVTECFGIIGNKVYSMDKIAPDSGLFNPLHEVDGEDVDSFIHSLPARALEEQPLVSWIPPSVIYEGKKLNVGG